MTFTPSSSEGDVDVRFECDATNLAGIDVVVFEEFYRIDTVTNRTPEEEKKNDIPSTQRLVAYHRDINDEGQTVSVRASDIASDWLASDLVQTGAAACAGTVLIAAGTLLMMTIIRRKCH